MIFLSYLALSKFGLVQNPNFLFELDDQQTCAVIGRTLRPRGAAVSRKTRPTVGALRSHREITAEWEGNVRFHVALGL